MKGTALIIPQSLQHEIVTQLHYDHLGIVKTRLRAKNTLYWTNINKDIESVIMVVMYDRSTNLNKHMKLSFVIKYQADHGRFSELIVSLEW